MTAADDTPQWRAQQTNPLAIVSMVCGMVALALGPLAILAIVFGHIARGQVRRTGEGSRGMATAGLILGYMVLVAGIALVVAFLASLPRWTGPSPGRHTRSAVRGFLVRTVHTPGIRVTTPARNNRVRPYSGTPYPGWARTAVSEASSACPAGLGGGGATVMTR